MGFRINTNVASLNAGANSALTSRALDTSLARLSSGLRINTAADDASGMAIADSLRTQANSLGQAISNANDGLAIMQTAERAMDEQLKILDTIKTKATQAAQDGQTQKTRTMIQSDINRLMEELDNIANTTSFNGKNLLSGAFVNQEFQIGASSNQTVKASIGDTSSSKIGLSRFETGMNINESSIVSLRLKNYNGFDDFNYKSVIISTSVGTGIGALAAEINKASDKTGIRANFKVESVGVGNVQKGHSFADFSINGIKIGKINYSLNDSTGSLVSAINAVKDLSGVEASIREGKLTLSSRDGRGIKVVGIGGASAIFGANLENYGRLSLIKAGGSDINIEGDGFGFSQGAFISQESVNLRQTKGQISPAQADAMGFNDKLGGKLQVISSQSVGGILAGFSPGSGMSANTAWRFRGLVVTHIEALYGISAGSGISNTKPEDAKLKTSMAHSQSAGVSTLKGAMGVMDIADTAIANLDAIRADIGSVQNQISATINNITVTQVNVKAAQSNIRDVDFALESANFSKNNILAQSGSYALTQANSAQQQVLRLLQ